MIMKKIIIWFMLLFLVFSYSFALKIDIQPIDDRVAPGETARYLINLTSEEIQNRTYTILMFPSFGSYSAIPYRFDLKSGENKLINLSLGVNEVGAKLGTYVSTIYFNYGTGSISETLRTFVELPLNKMIKINSVSMPETIDPRKTINITFEITNSYKKKPINVLITVYKEKENITSFNKKLDVELGTKNYTISLNLPHLFYPGNYTFEIKEMLYGSIISSEIQNIKIEPFSNAVILTQKNETIFGKTINVLLINNGTEELRNYDLKQKLSFLESLLVIDSGGSEKQGTNLVWKNISLQPSVIKNGVIEYSTLSFSYSITYVPLLILPFLIIGIIWVLILNNRKVVVIKTVRNYKQDDKELKATVKIILRNVGTRKLRRIKVVERLPAFTKKIHSFGSLKPEFKSVGQTKRLIWSLENLNPREEIHLSYKIQSTIGVIGTIVFPPTQVFVKDKTGTYLRKSNMVTLVLKRPIE